MKKTLVLIVAILGFSAFGLFAQTEESPIDSLSEKLYKGSNRYSEGGITYRVIRWDDLRSYFSDIKALDAAKSEEIISSKEKINDLIAKNTAQAESYDVLNEKYNNAVKANDAMAFFSLLIPKQKYNFMMWGLVVALSAFAVVLFLMYKRSHQVTTHAKKELSELSEEFDAYRKRTLKREQEVAAGYQREINKLKA